MGKKINFLEDCKRYLEQFFAQKDKVLGRNYEVAWKMAESTETKQYCVEQNSSECVVQ